MALAWDTYRAIPRLANYTEAKEYHDDILPIRGDAHKTRPCGRRVQKWFSIWEDKDAIHVGYGSGEHDNRTKLVTYHKAGSIMVHHSHRYGNASNNERLHRLLGKTVQTHQYDAWINCAYYNNGKLERGWQQLRSDTPSVFTRDGDNLVFVNYAFPVTHKINRTKMKEFMEAYQPFVEYVRGLAKLQGGRLNFTNDTCAEVFEVDQYNRAMSPNIRWGSSREEVQVNRLKFFAWARSDDPMNKLRAAITLNSVTYWAGDPIESFKEYVIRTYKQDVLDCVQHTDGKLVKDRLRRFLMW
jgi:hypothetical protein